MSYREPAWLTRRSAIALLGLGMGLYISRVLAQDGGSSGDDIDSLQPGQFIWHPERAPKGPVAIIVSIPKQRVFVYRNGILIGVSTCSTGKPGHSTPAGVFTILEKAKTHTSVKYDEPMPDMERLTWKGIALHVGDLPGYPSSHGCVHLPQDFAGDLYAITQVGTPVIIAGGHTDPASVADPGPILGTAAKEEMEFEGGAGDVLALQPRCGHLDSRVAGRQENLCAPECRYRRRGGGDHRESIPTARLQCLCLARRRRQGFDLGRQWAFMPILPSLRRRTPTCFNASTARPA